MTTPDTVAVLSEDYPSHVRDSDNSNLFSRLKKKKRTQTVKHVFLRTHGPQLLLNRGLIKYLLTMKTRAEELWSI